MDILQQPTRTAAFLKSEGNGDISRELITLAILATAIPSGQVLGVVTASGQYAPYNPAATDGTETAAAVLYGAAQASDATQSAAAIVRLDRKSTRLNSSH